MNFDYIKEHASGIFFGTGCACMIATVTSAILNTKSNQLKIDEIKKMQVWMIFIKRKK